MIHSSMLDLPRRSHEWKQEIVDFRVFESLEGRLTFDL